MPLLRLQAPGGRRPAAGGAPEQGLGRRAAAAGPQVQAAEVELHRADRLAPVGLVEDLRAQCLAIFSRCTPVS